MIITPNPEMDRTILNHLADLYQIYDKREPNHLSSYIYCLTKAYWEQVNPIKPTDEEVLLFCLGYGLQDVFTPKDATIPVYENEGIIYRPDLEFPLLLHPGEIKTTRASPKTHAEKGYPDSWLEYMMGVCFLKDVRHYELLVLYMIGYWRPPTPLLKCVTIEFTDDEVFDNWSRILERKHVLDTAMISAEVPQPFKYALEWECKNCRYIMFCQAQEFIGDYPPDTLIDSHEEKLIKESEELNGN